MAVRSCGCGILLQLRYGGELERVESDRYGGYCLKSLQKSVPVKASQRKDQQRDQIVLCYDDPGIWFHRAEHSRKNRPYGSTSASIDDLFTLGQVSTPENTWNLPSRRPTRSMEIHLVRFPCEDTNVIEFACVPVKRSRSLTSTH